MCVYVYLYIYIYVYLYICILCVYIHIERDRERERKTCIDMCIFHADLCLTLCFAIAFVRAAFTCARTHTHASLFFSLLLALPDVNVRECRRGCDVFGAPEMGGGRPLAHWTRWLPCHRPIPLTHSLTHSPPPSLTHSFTHSLPHSYVCVCTCDHVYVHVDVYVDAINYI